MDKAKRLTDEELVGLYIKGNNEAFDILLNRYESKVFSYVIYAVHNQEVAEDLFQDIFMRVISALQAGKYTEQQKFGCWISRIAHNIVLDYHRQEKNENAISNDETEIDLLTEIALADENNVESKMIETQTMGGIEEIIRMLPENQQEVIRLRYYEDKSFKEIADIIGVSINTALGRVRYALINLRKLCNEHNISLTA